MLLCLDDQVLEFFSYLSAEASWVTPALVNELQNFIVHQLLDRTTPSLILPACDIWEDAGGVEFLFKFKSGLLNRLLNSSYIRACIQKTLLNKKEIALILY